MSTPNTFLQNPLKVVIYRPPLLRQGGDTTASDITYVSLGDIPHNIRAAVFSGKSEPLRDYYGPYYATKLAMGDKRPREVIGAGFRAKSGAGFRVESGAGAGDFDLIEELLEEKPEAAKQQQQQKFERHKKGTHYITDVYVYPEDRMSELKEKIYLMTGIPTYRQHIFYVNSRGLQQLYRIHLDGAYEVDIRAIESADQIFGIPVDKRLHSAHDNIHVEAFDTMTTLDHALDLSHLVYVVDLAEFTRPILSQLQDKLDDKYHTDLFFYGFVFKYWPHFTRDAFVEFIRAESELSLRFPDFAKPRAVIASVCKSEAELINDKYRHANKIQRWADDNIAVSIVQMTAFVPSTKSATINIRNLFDKLRVSAIIPEIHARVTLNHTTYILRKRHIRNGSEITFPSIAAMREGVTIAISLRKQDQENFHEKRTHSTVENEQSRYLFLAIHPSGKYFIRTIWNEEDNLDFEEVTSIIKSFVDPIIKGVNSLGRFVFVSGRELPLITPANLQFENLSICIYWRKTLQESFFKLLRSMWEPYLHAKITAPRHVIQMDRYEFLFRKGMYDFDTVGIDRIISSVRLSGNNSQYAFMTNSAIKQKWDQNYDGHIVRMSHRTSDIRFEAVNIRRGEFESFYGFIAYFSYTAAQQPQIREQRLSVSTATKKLNKLKEQDPELFNLKKHGVNYQYSVKCQKPRQPVVYNENELESMSRADVSKLTKYWNFTLGKPAWYGCPARLYPHLSFIVGVHPKHYCLPCCNKKPLSDDSKRMSTRDKCLTDHMFEPVKATSYSPHIMVYGKKLEPGRISRMPPGNLKHILVPPSLAGEFLLYGVQQNMQNTSRVGVIFAAAAILQMTPRDFIMRAKGHDWTTYLGGKLIEHFSSTEMIDNSLEDLFIRDSIPTKTERTFTQWSELFVEIALRVFGLQIITFIDAEGDASAITVYISPEQMDAIAVMRGDERYGFVLRRGNEYMPVFFMNPQNYFKTGEIIHRIYTGDMQVAKNIRAMALYSQGKNKYTIGRIIDLAFLRGVGAIKRAYVNKQNYCYAAIVSIEGGPPAYIPVDYSPYLITDTVDFGQPDFTGITAAGVVSAVDAINTAIATKFAVGLSQYNYRPIKLTARAMSAGRMIGPAGEYGDIYRMGDAAGFEDLPALDLGYDIDHLNSLIREKAPPIIDATVTRLGEAMWTNYAYLLFVTEFMGYIENERSVEMRKKLRELIDKSDMAKAMKAFKRELAALLTEYPQDIAALYTQLLTVYYSNYSKEDFARAVDTTIYEFDRLTMVKLLALPFDSRAAELERISVNFTEENPSFDPSGVSFPNIYLPCEDLARVNAGSTLCDHGRLIVTDRRKFCRYLAADLADPLRYKYLTSATWADTVVDPLKFHMSPTEIITIYRLI